MHLFSRQNIARFSAATSSVASPNAISSGCGSTASWAFDFTNHSNQTLGNRSFLVNIPPGFNPDIPHAVVFSFHGNQNLDTHESNSGFSEKNTLINGKGIISVYPMAAVGLSRDGTSQERAWQGAPDAEPDVDDIGFTNSLIDHLQSTLCVDTKRIYAAGEGTGGGFVNLLACTPSTANRIAAFAPVSPALYAGTKSFDGCEPGRSVPLLHYHGLADDSIPFGGQTANTAGNTNYATPNITQYRESWALRNGCNSTIPTSFTQPDSNTTLKQWECSSDDPNAIIKGYTVTGLGHSWPTTSALDGGVTYFNATTRSIIPFFEAHSLS